MTFPESALPTGADAEYKAARGAWVDLKAKETQDWGAQQASALWDNLYSRHEPLINGRVVLDLGCSWGYMLKFLSERFKPARLIGTDVKPWWESRTHGWDFAALGDRVQFFAGDLPSITAIRPSSVDLILCTSVLQYMSPEQLEGNLTRCYDLLRPGGEMILRTRVFTSYIGADLHREIELPYVHLLYGERDLAAHVRRTHQKEPPYLNWFTASTYLAVFVRTGFEVLDVRRRMNKNAPAVMERVSKAFPWVSPEELLCAELEARLTRPIEPEELDMFGKVVITRGPSGMEAFRESEGPSDSAPTGQ